MDCNRIGRKIAKTEKCDEYIVMIAALLHDVDDIKISGTKNYENSRRIMADCHITADIIERVNDVVREVSFKGTETIAPKSIESKIVQDADRLDAMGAIGIARAFAYGGSHNRAIHIPYCKPNTDMNEADRRSRLLFLVGCDTIFVHTGKSTFGDGICWINPNCALHCFWREEDTISCQPAGTATHNHIQ